MNKTLLVFGKGNAKLDGNIQTFSLPSGFTCPGASACLSKANRDTGKITDGAGCEFRCFSASQECLFRNVRESRWNNLELLRTALTVEGMKALILQSLPSTPFQVVVRIHVAGDFFSQAYFDAWLEVAKEKKNFLLYAYTKSLPFWVARLADIPSNFILTASFGGKFDAMIEAHNLRFAKVVYTEEQAAALGLEIDHDDSHAYTAGASFALLLHGTQPAGTPANMALRKLRKEKKGGYGGKGYGLHKKKAAKGWDRFNKMKKAGGSTPDALAIGAKSVSVENIAA